MSLNIKDEETHRLVRELAQLTGESQTTGVFRLPAPAGSGGPSAFVMQPDGLWLVLSKRAERP
jgi:hypothetical protein